MKNANALTLIRTGDVARLPEGQSIRVLGIDLGTTNSTVSEGTWEVSADAPPRVECLEVVQPTLQGDYTHVLLPSVVAIHGGRILVGEGAKRLRSRASELGLRQNRDVFYECKNDIGNRKRYHRAPAGFTSAAKIGGKVLRFLYEAAMENDASEMDRVVVTVPASFQAAQRQDTLEAAWLAGLHLEGGDLLDEPIAAFLDYVIAHRDDLAPKLAQPRSLVVVDFGGGTCDVAIFRLHGPAGAAEPMRVEWLAVSRYHRLGGADIDAAIVHDVLIPELCRQNDIEPLDLSYDQKKNQLEPALLGLAEMLKVGLCIDIRRLTSFGKYEAADKEQVTKAQPGVHHCKLGDRTLRLSSPKLTAAQFEALIEPFLDRDLLYARETEYRLTCSIFAPIQDALDRAGLDAKSVDLCLMVGGSSLIPQVFDAVKEFFPNGEVLTYAHRDDVKACVSRGAAYHALALAVFGRGLVQPICHDAIAIRATSGLFTLIEKGTTLPYPHDGSFARFDGLAVPRTVLAGSCELRVELVAVSDERSLLSGLWDIPGSVEQGDPICVEYRLDENQVLTLHARLTDADDGKHFAASVENPLTNVVNPEPKRMKIDRMEEEVRTGRVRKSDVPQRVADIAELYADLGQREKAIEFLQRAMRAKGSPDETLLNRLAHYYGLIGNAEREEKVYREACSVSQWSGSWFNLSLALKRHGKLAEAADAVAEAVKLERSGPYLVQAALIARGQGDTEGSNSVLAEAIAAFNPVRALNDWELGWFVTAAQALGDDARLVEGRNELRRRARRVGEPPPTLGELPRPRSGTLRSQQ